MSFLISSTLCFSNLFAFGENIQSSVEDLFDGMKAIAGKIATHISLIWLGVIVALEIENPEGIQMRMDWHVQSIGSNVVGVWLAIILLVSIVAGLAALPLRLIKEKEEHSNDYYQLDHCV